MSDATPSSNSMQCAECAQPITSVELSQGLAVRVDGHLVCPNCVDALPGEAQIRINQFRAVRGLNVTTYRVSLRDHPRLHAYSFTTAANITLHRRELQETGRFEAPLLPPSSPPELATPPPPPPPMRSRPAPAPLAKHFPLIAVAVAVVLVAVIVATSGPGPKPPTIARVEAPQVIVPVVEARSRISYDTDPLRAWAEATSDRACPTAVLQAIADQLSALRQQQLDGAEVALRTGNLAEANRLIEALTLPDHLYFRGVQSREAEVATLRLATLSTRPTPPPAPVRPPEMPVPRPEPPPVVAVVAPVEPPKPPALPPSPPEPSRPVMPSPSERFTLLPELMLLPERGPWQTNEWTAKLEHGDDGVLERNLALAGGRYQLWAFVRSAHNDAWLDFSIGEVRCDRLKVEGNKKETWYRLNPGALVLPAGSQRLRITAHGRWWQIYRIYIAGADQPSPFDQNAGWGSPLAWRMDQRLQGPKVSIWEPRFIDAPASGPIELNPYDEEARIPPGRPINGGTRLFPSQLDRKNRHRLVLDLAGASTNEGGIVVVVHPRRDDRTQLLVTLADDAGRTWDPPPLAVQPGRWNTLIIPCNPPANTIAIDKLKTLTIADPIGGPNPLTTPFLLARVVTISDATPSAELLKMRTATLKAPSGTVLDELLSALGRARGKSRQWRKEWNIENVRFLAGSALTTGDAANQLHSGMDEIYGGGKWQDNGGAATLVLDEASLSQFFAQRLEPDRFHVAIFSFAGIEIPERRREGAAFKELCKALIDASVKKAVLPVMCLGPLRADDDKAGVIRAEPDDIKRWQEIEQLLVRLPVIDLRHIIIPDPQHLTATEARACNRAILDGLAELVGRVRYLQKVPPR